MQHKASSEAVPWRLVAAVAGILLAAATPATAENSAAAAVHLAQAQPEAPAITIAPTILCEPASRLPLPIAVGPSRLVPARSFLRLRGVPLAVSLSAGHAIAPGAWAIPLAALPTLSINVPAGVSGRSELTITLVAEDGAVLAEARSALVVSAAAARASPAEPKPSAVLEPRAAAPLLSPEERERAEKLLARAERDLEEGNIAQARQFLLRATEAGLARAALLLAATYDPRELARLRAQGVQSNPALARKWYERARELGAPEAEERLTRLGGS